MGNRLKDNAQASECAVQLCSIHRADVGGCGSGSQETRTPAIYAPRAATLLRSDRKGRERGGRRSSVQERMPHGLFVPDIS